MLNGNALFTSEIQERERGRVGIEKGRSHGKKDKREWEWDVEGKRERTQMEWRKEEKGTKRYRQ